MNNKRVSFFCDNFSLHTLVVLLFVVIEKVDLVNDIYRFTDNHTWHRNNLNVATFFTVRALAFISSDTFHSCIPCSPMSSFIHHALFSMTKIHRTIFGRQSYSMISYWYHMPFQSIAFVPHQSFRSLCFGVSQLDIVKFIEIGVFFFMRKKLK